MFQSAACSNLNTAAGTSHKPWQTGAKFRRIESAMIQNEMYIVKPHLSIHLIPKTSKRILNSFSHVRASFSQKPGAERNKIA